MLHNESENDCLYSISFSLPNIKRVSPNVIAFSENELNTKRLNNHTEVIHARYQNPKASGLEGRSDGNS